MPKRDYSNYNILDDDLKNDQVEEKNIQEDRGQKEEKQEESLQGDLKLDLAPDKSMMKVELSKVDVHNKSEENLEKQPEESEIKQEAIKEINKVTSEPINVNQEKQNLQDFVEKEEPKEEEYCDKQPSTKKEKKSERQLIKNNFFHKDNQKGNGTIPEYKRFYQQKERSSLFKWCMRFARTAILIMLLPLWALITISVICVIGGFLLGIAVFIGTGVFILGIICFMSSQVSLSIVALGISVAITSAAFGGIILIIFIALMKWAINLVRKYKRPRIKVSNKEVI